MPKAVRKKKICPSWRKKKLRKIVPFQQPKLFTKRKKNHEGTDVTQSKRIE